jgi:hypothetical protein
MRFVAYAEVAIFARVLIGALLLRNSLLAPLFYAHFCRLRFYMSSFTREAFSHVGAKLDEATTHNACPPVVRKAYVMGTDVVSASLRPSWCAVDAKLTRSADLEIRKHCPLRARPGRSRRRRRRSCRRKRRCCTRSCWRAPLSLARSLCSCCDALSRDDAAAGSEQMVDGAGRLQTGRTVMTPVSGRSEGSGHFSTSLSTLDENHDANSFFVQERDGPRENESLQMMSARGLDERERVVTRTEASGDVE